VAVPTALNNGVNGPASLANPLSVFCVLYGTHVPFTQARLSALYPSNAAYHAKIAADVARLIAQRFLLPAGGLTLIREARHTSVTG
jgi:hypothetical protein